MWVSCLQTVFSCFLIGLKVKRCLNDIWKKRLQNKCAKSTF